MRLLKICGLFLLVTMACCAPANAAESVLKPGDRVAIIGDSITEQKLYSKYVEAYLLACSGVPDVKVMQFGWSGETAGGFANRAENDLAVFKPTVATTCYGMNDGGYQPWRVEIGTNYENAMRDCVKKMQAAGVRNIVLGSPGAVDLQFFRPGKMMGDRTATDAYNDNLAHLRDIDKKLAEEYKQSFANVHDAMYDAMKKAQAELGNTYPVCGGDGFHPGPNGQLIMAYAFLKGLGVDGNIGDIAVDMGGKAEATKGHEVGSFTNGKLELKSTRWPFCFDGDDKNPNGTRSILKFLPFNDELNRLTLKVNGLKANKAKVAWGAETQEFTREQLEKGVNLMASFTQTPFDAEFQKLVGAIGNKQNFETVMIKQIITNFRAYPAELKDDAELQAALQTIRSRLGARQQQFDADARKTLTPVTHTLVITPIE
jgi:lysophospholipase L1-like esterase